MGQQRDKELANIAMLRKYLETMPMSTIWLNVVIGTHEDVDTMMTNSNEIKYVIEKLKDKPDVVRELVGGIVYTLQEHADDIRAQTDCVIHSIEFKGKEDE